jgi:hypothetical protein
VCSCLCSTLTQQVALYRRPCNVRGHQAHLLFEAHHPGLHLAAHAGGHARQAGWLHPAVLMQGTACICPAVTNRVSARARGHAGARARQRRHRRLSRSHTRRSRPAWRPVLRANEPGQAAAVQLVLRTPGAPILPGARVQQLSRRADPDRPPAAPRALPSAGGSGPAVAQHYD